MALFFDWQTQSTTIEPSKTREQWVGDIKRDLTIIETSLEDTEMRQLCAWVMTLVRASPQRVQKKDPGIPLIVPEGAVRARYQGDGLDTIDPVFDGLYKMYTRYCQHMLAFLGDIGFPLDPEVQACFAPPTDDMEPVDVLHAHCQAILDLMSNHERFDHYGRTLTECTHHLLDSFDIFVKCNHFLMIFLLNYNEMKRSAAPAATQDRMLVHELNVAIINMCHPIIFHMFTMYNISSLESVFESHLSHVVEFIRSAAAERRRLRETLGIVDGFDDICFIVLNTVYSLVVNAFGYAHEVGITYRMPESYQYIVCRTLLTPGSLLSLLNPTEAGSYVSMCSVICHDLSDKSMDKLRKLLLHDVLQWRQEGFASLIVFLNTPIMELHHSRQHAAIEAAQRSLTDLLTMDDAAPRRRTQRRETGAAAGGQRETPVTTTPVTTTSVSRKTPTVTYADGAPQGSSVTVTDMIRDIEACTPLPLETIWWAAQIHDTQGTACWTRMIVLKNNVDRHLVAELKRAEVTEAVLRAFVRRGDSYRTFLFHMLCDIHSYAMSGCGLLNIPTTDVTHAAFLWTLERWATGGDAGAAEPVKGDVMALGNLWLLVVESNVKRPNHHWCSRLHEVYTEHKKRLTSYLESRYGYTPTTTSLKAFLDTLHAPEDAHLKQLCAEQLHHRYEYYRSICTMSPSGVKVLHTGLLRLAVMIGRVL
jgi:hypothetical protein